MRRVLGLFLLLLANCSSGSSSPTTDTSAASDADAATPAKGTRSLTIDAPLMVVDGNLTFLSPGGASEVVSAAELIGKPYFVGAYPAGFSPGTDPPRDFAWGTVPEDLHIRYTTPAHYADGPYDMTLVIYRVSQITDKIMNNVATQAPPAAGGDLATFTLDTSAVRPGDPSLPPGLVRLNIEGKDAEISVTNRPLVDLNDPVSATNAYKNIVMVIP